MSSATDAAIPAAPAPSGPPAHAQAFRFRRFLNWFPLGLAYAFLYMGRYNLSVAKTNLGDLMSKEDFGYIFAAGTWVYGISFLLNGPMTDKFGGRRSMLLSVVGACGANLAMGWFIWSMLNSPDPGSVNVRLWMSVLYGLNMYFQSFGAVAIVKVNASWFHVRERGGFSGIFGTMISSGIFLAYTVNEWILAIVKPADPTAIKPTWVVFFAPALLLGIIAVVEFFLLRDRPSEAGQQDFDVGDGDSGKADDGVTILTVMKRIFTNPVILTIAAIEFCTGLVRQGVMQWFPIYRDEVWVLPGKHALVRGDVSLTTMIASIGSIAVGAALIALAVRSPKLKNIRGSLATIGALIALTPFMGWGWGGVLFVAGVIGGNAAGYVSDLFFQSRRAPAAGGLYLGLTGVAIVMVFALGQATTEVGWVDLEKEKVLQKGDRIVAIAGVTDVKDWRDVSRAVKCVPATCVAPRALGDKAPPSYWDSKSCTCSSRLKANSEGFVASTGTLSATIVRGEETLELELKDPKPKMVAGDSRKLAAGPKLTVTPWFLGLLGFLASLCVIGTHGLLSGTATMDFGGRKGAATAVGVIDGFVYLGSGLSGIALGSLTTTNWSYWPMFLVPFSLVGFLLCLPIWNSKPRPRGGGH
jgi:MFS transporter, OPA family, glycerol-3-phosphate transporter